MKNIRPSALAIRHPLPDVARYWLLNLPLAIYHPPLSNPLFELNRR